MSAAFQDLIPGWYPSDWICTLTGKKFACLSELKSSGRTGGWLWVSNVKWLLSPTPENVLPGAEAPVGSFRLIADYPSCLAKEETN